MTNGRVPADADIILDRLFECARSDQRELSADELMRAIGLKRTSIYSTYAHINARRAAHNRIIRSERHSDHGTGRPVALDRSAETIGRLRQELAAERRRSEQYANVIRRLALENHELKHSDGVVTDARDRFRST